MQGRDPSAQPPRFRLFHLLILLWLFIIVQDIFQYRKNVDSIPYSQFVQMVNQGEVSNAVISSDQIEGTFKEPRTNKTHNFVTTKVDDPNLIQRLTAKGVHFSGVHESGFLRELISWITIAVILAVVWGFIINRAGQFPRGGGILPMGKSKARIYVEKELSTRFDDVADVEEAKEELKEIVNFLRDPSRYSKLGGRMPKGILLIGPPGTGKTLLARAVAGEARVPFFSINGSEFVELFVGLGAARVRDLFEQARSQAPCIVFIDELDALGKARGLSAITGSANDEKEQTLNQLLAEMDGFDTSRGIVILAATNRPEVLDPALLRAGRFDRHILVDKPDRLGRTKILAIHFKSIKMAQDVNIDTIAAMTPGFSGADLANLVNEAALIATRRGADSVQLRDCTEAVERIVAGLEHKNRLLNPQERRRVAYHEMGHAVVAMALDEGEVIHKVSIIPRGISALGYTFRRPTEDRYLMSRHELENKMTVAMGGRASEMVFFSDISTGAADDLDKATEIARAMITRYGMNSELGLAILEKEPAPILGSQAAVRSYEYSEKTARVIDHEVEAMLHRLLARAQELVSRYRTLVEEGAKILLNKETLDEGELIHLWKTYGHPGIIGTALSA